MNSHGSRHEQRQQTMQDEKMRITRDDTQIGWTDSCLSLSLVSDLLSFRPDATAAAVLSAACELHRKNISLRPPFLTPLLPSFRLPFSCVNAYSFSERETEREIGMRDGRLLHS